MLKVAGSMSTSTGLAPSRTMQPAVAVIFGGDMMFDRTIRQAMASHGDDYVFSCVADLLRSADLVVANLEGPITSHESVSEDSEPGDGLNYTFTFPTSTASLLARHNIRLVSLGNNHIMNFSREAVRVRGAKARADRLRGAAADLLEPEPELH